jgi:hypothetical protein
LIEESLSMTTTLTEKTFAQLLTAAGGANGTRVNAQGRIEAAVAPAFDHDPITKAAKGLRFRGPARTNLLQNSQLASGVAEGTTPPTVGSATVDGEDCSFVTFVPGLNFGYAGSRWRSSGNMIGAIAVSTTYSWSIHVKLSRPLTGTESLTVYYTGTSAMGSFVIDAAKSTQFVDRFTRISVSGATPNVNGSVYPVVHTNNAAMASSLTVWVCKGQLEVGTTPSSYIAVPSTTPMMRTVDQTSIPNLQSQPWYNPREGTICARVAQATNLVPATSMIFGITDAAGATSRMLVYFDGAGGISANCFDRGAQQAATSIAGSAAPIGQVRKVAMSWKQGRFIVQCDDKPAVAVGLASIPTYTGPTLWLGQRNNGADPFDGFFQDFVYWPKAANATEIVSLTPETETITG